MQKTGIGWTDYSCNPFKLQLPDGALLNACVHKSEGCRRCYAESIVRRWWQKDKWGEFPGYTIALLKIGKPVLLEKELTQVLNLSDRIADGKADPAENKVFWNDMTDEFLDFWPDEFIDKVFAVRALAPNLIHQVLTKRAERLCSYMSQYVAGKRKLGSALGERDTIGARLLLARHGFGVPDFRSQPPYPPPKHVHLGVSVEDKPNALERINCLLQTPAAVRWLSIEPLLEDFDPEMRELRAFTEYRRGELNGAGAEILHSRPRVDGIVIGGESGAGHREMPIDTAIRIARLADAVGVSVFVKQDSGPRPGMRGRFPDDVWAMKGWPGVALAV